MHDSPRLRHHERIARVARCNDTIKSDPTVPSSVSKEKKEKIFYEHGKDALELALSVANMQEEKALRKAEKHQQPQVDRSRGGRKNGSRSDDRKKRLEEAKIMIAKRRSEAKKEKARFRKESRSRLRQQDDARITALEKNTNSAPRKRVSFA